MSNPDPANVEQLALNLTTGLAQMLELLKVLAHFDQTRAFQIAGLVREHLDQLPKGN